MLVLEPDAPPAVSLKVGAGVGALDIPDDWVVVVPVGAASFSNPAVTVTGIAHFDMLDQSSVPVVVPQWPCAVLEHLALSPPRRVHHATFVFPAVVSVMCISSVDGPSITVMPSRSRVRGDDGRVDGLRLVVEEVQGHGDAVAGLGQGLRDEPAG